MPGLWCEHDAILCAEHSNSDPIHCELSDTTFDGFSGAREVSFGEFSNDPFDW